MRIWVDAERTPRSAGEIVRRAGVRLGIPVRFVIREPVSNGDRETARARLVEEAEPGDLVVTDDDVLGPELARRGVVAIDPRGGEFEAPGVAAAPGALELLASVRSLEVGERGTPPYDARAKRAFAATLDRVLSRSDRERAADGARS